MRLRNVIGSILLGGVVYACAGDRASPTQPDQVLQIADAWSSGPPPDAPPEFQEDTRITEMDLNVYFADSFTATEARFGAFATNVRVEALARLQEWDGSDLASDTDVEARAEPWPWSHRVTAMAAVPYSTPCGLRNRGRGSYRAWHQYLGTQWGLKESSDGKIASLDPCSCDDTAVISDPDYDPYNPDCETSGSGGGNAAPFPWAKRVVSDLRGAQPLEIDGLGEITALLIWLPAFGQ